MASKIEIANNKTMTLSTARDLKKYSEALLKNLLSVDVRGASKTQVGNLDIAVRNMRKVVGNLDALINDVNYVNECIKAVGL